MADTPEYKWASTICQSTFGILLWSRTPSSSLSTAEAWDASCSAQCCLPAPAPCSCFLLGSGSAGPCWRCLLSSWLVYCSCCCTRTIIRFVSLYPTLPIDLSFYSKPVPCINWTPGMWLWGLRSSCATHCDQTRNTFTLHNLCITYVGCDGGNLLVHVEVDLLWQARQLVHRQQQVDHVCNWFIMILWTVEGVGARCFLVGGDRLSLPGDEHAEFLSYPSRTFSAYSITLTR